MKTFTNKDIRNWLPCYDPDRYLKEEDSHTVLSILNRRDIPFKDRLWCIARKKFLSEKLMRLNAIWCARQVEHLMTDDRSKMALNVAENFCLGKATEVEFDTSRRAAYTAAFDVSAAYNSYYTDNKINSNNVNAAFIVSYATNNDVEVSMYATAYATGWTQEEKLKEMIIEGEQTGDVF